MYVGSVVEEALMRIGFACDWKKPRFRTWSHTAYSLYQALSNVNGVQCVDMDLSLSQVEVYAYALLNAKMVNGTLKSKFRYSLAYARRLEKNFERQLKRHAPLDAIIEIIDPAVTEEVPCYFYQDVSVDMLIDYLKQYGKPRPQFEMLSMDDLLRWQERQYRMYEHCAGVFCMTRTLAESLVSVTGLSASKVHVVHAGVHVTPVQVPGPLLKKTGQPLILFVGRDFFRKGGDLVVEAFKVARKELLPEATLVVAGPKKWPLVGPIPDGVIFLGDARWETLQQYYSIADLFCMPSRAEGFGIVYAEALCFGLPVIGRKTEVISETIQDGVNGYLLEGDDVYKLAELMTRGVQNEEMRRKVKELAPQYYEYYSWKRVASDMVRVVKTDRETAV